MPFGFRDFGEFIEIGKKYKTTKDYYNWIIQQYPELRNTITPTMNKNTLSSKIYQHEKQLSRNKEEPTNLLDFMFKINEEFWSKSLHEQVDDINRDIDKLVARNDFKPKIDEKVEIRDFHEQEIHCNTDIRNKTFNELMAEQFKNVCLNTPGNANVLFVVKLANGGQGYFRLNKQNIDFVAALIESGGNYVDTIDYKTDGSDIDWYGEEMQIESIKIIDIDQLPDDLKKYHIKKNVQGFFPYILTTNKFGDLSKYQMFQEHQERNDELCLIYALRMAGLDELTLLNISHDLETFPFVTNSGIKYIAEKYDLHIMLGTVYISAKRTQIKNNEFGDKDATIINLLSFNNHVIYVDNYKEKKNIAKMLNEIYNSNYLQPIPIKFEKQVKELPIIFDISKYETRRYKSKSENLISQYYSSIPDLYQVGGNVQAAMRKCCYGSRILIIDKKTHITEPVVDCDINSLYPYAISKLFLQLGKPKVLGPQTFDFVISHQFDELQEKSTEDKFISSAFMLINITKIGKVRKYPVLNNLCLGEHWVDLITLEDLIKYHEIEGEIINGFYYDGNRDYSIRYIIENLYEIRHNNPEYKLIMNKIYGYTIRKRIHTKEIDVDDTLEYMIKHYHCVINSKNNKVTKYKKWTSLYNMTNFGSYILSMSKRIMNEIIYNLEDKGIDVLYSDTDSIFIRESDLPQVEHKFGNKLGEFKIDFDYGYRRATEMIILTKKRYICKLDENKYHFRYIFKNKKDIKNPWEFFKSQLKI